VKTINVEGNRAKKAQFGFFFSSDSNVLITRNSSESNLKYGFVLTNMPGLTANFNNVAYNSNGIFMSGIIGDLRFNNYYGNILCNVRVAAGGPGTIDPTQNWWGSTAWSNISPTILSNPPPAASFQPWRLFGKFDTGFGADVLAPEQVNGLSATNSGVQIQLRWNKILNASGDFVRYGIYRSTVSTNTNLTKADLAAYVSGVGNTNYVDTPPSSRRWYYWVTALDDATPGQSVLTNESWYSHVDSASNGGSTGPFFVDDTSGNDANPGIRTSPFRTIQKAVNAMSVGLPNCTVASAYIFPGTRSSSVQPRMS
jgi:hypothetical protein